MNAQKRKLPGFIPAPASPRKKCAMKMRKPFIALIQETGENDLHEPRGDDCGYNEGTICLVGGLIVDREMVFRAWAHKRTPLNSQWLAGTQDWWRRSPPLLGC